MVNTNTTTAKQTANKTPFDVGLGRKGAVRQRKEEVVEQYGHKFVQQQFYNVMRCALCGEFLKYAAGMQCSDCNYTCHKKCYPKVVTKCITQSNAETDPDEAKLNHRIPHRFENFSNMGANWCCHCGYILPLGRKQTKKCTGTWFLNLSMLKVLTLSQNVVSHVTLIASILYPTSVVCLWNLLIRFWEKSRGPGEVSRHRARPWPQPWLDEHYGHSQQQSRCRRRSNSSRHHQVKTTRTDTLTERINPRLRLQGRPVNHHTTLRPLMPHASPLGRRAAHLRQPLLLHNSGLSQIEHNPLLLLPMLPGLQWKRLLLLLLRTAELNQKVTWLRAEEDQEVIPRINAYRNNHNSHLHHNMCLTTHRRLQISQATAVLINNQVHRTHNLSLPSLTHNHHNKLNHSSHHLYSHNRHNNHHLSN
jgi:hypothetical protein